MRKGLPPSTSAFPQIDSEDETLKLLLPLFLSSAVMSLAGTIISVTGPPPALFIGTAAQAVSWTQTGAYSNVAVSAVMSNASGIGATLNYHAYLTNALGGGATVANEIASTSFSLAAGFNQNVEVFNGLSLGSGTYFLVISSDIGANGSGGWSVITTAPTVTLDTGVTRNADGSTSSSTGYPPGRTFSNITGGTLLYSVTTDESVPEPATTALLGAGLALMIFRHTRRQR